MFLRALTIHALSSFLALSLICCHASRARHSHGEVEAPTMPNSPLPEQHKGFALEYKDGCAFSEKRQGCDNDTYQSLSTEMSHENGGISRYKSSGDLPDTSLAAEDDNAPKDIKIHEILLDVHPTGQDFLCVGDRIRVSARICGNSRFSAEMTQPDHEYGVRISSRVPNRPRGPLDNHASRAEELFFLPLGRGPMALNKSVNVSAQNGSEDGRFNSTSLGEVLSFTMSGEKNKCSVRTDENHGKMHSLPHRVQPEGTRLKCIHNPGCVLSLVGATIFEEKQVHRSRLVLTFNERTNMVPMPSRVEVNTLLRLPEALKHLQSHGHWVDETTLELIVEDGGQDENYYKGLVISLEEAPQPSTFVADESTEGRLALRARDDDDDRAASNFSDIGMRGNASEQPFGARPLTNSQGTVEEFCFVADEFFRAESAGLLTIELILPPNLEIGRDLPDLRQLNFSDCQEIRLKPQPPKPVDPIKSEHTVQFPVTVASEGFIIEAADLPSPKTSESGWAIGSWIYPADYGTDSYQTLFYKGEGGEHRTPSVFFAPQSRRLSIRVSAEANMDMNVESNIELKVQEWTHLLFSFQNRTDEITGDASSLYSISVYVNGNLELAIQYNVPILSNDGAIHFGSSQYWREGFRGFLANIVIFEKALDEKAAKNIFEGEYAFLGYLRGQSIGSRNTFSTRETEKYLHGTESAKTLFEENVKPLGQHVLEQMWSAVGLLTSGDLAGSPFSQGPQLISTLNEDESLAVVSTSKITNAELLGGPGMSGHRRNALDAHMSEAASLSEGSDLGQSRDSALNDMEDSSDQGRQRRSNHQAQESGRHVKDSGSNGSPRLPLCDDSSVVSREEAVLIIEQTISQLEGFELGPLGELESTIDFPPKWLEQSVHEGVVEAAKRGLVAAKLLVALDQLRFDLSEFSLHQLQRSSVVDRKRDLESILYSENVSEGINDDCLNDIRRRLKRSMEDEQRLLAKFVSFHKNLARAHGGYKYAQYMASIHAERPVSLTSIKDAIRYLQIAGSNGYGLALHVLGILHSFYNLGENVDPAAEYFRDTYRVRYTKQESNIAPNMIEGSNTFIRAIAYFHGACLMGQDRSCLALGKSYQRLSRKLSSEMTGMGTSEKQSKSRDYQEMRSGESMDSEKLQGTAIVADNRFEYRTKGSIESLSDEASFSAGRGEHTAARQTSLELSRRQVVDAASFYLYLAAAPASDFFQQPGHQPQHDMQSLLTDSDLLAESAAEDKSKGQKGEDDELYNWYDSLAEQGNHQALVQLADWYYWGGRGLRRDHQRAFVYFNMAANAGNVAGCVALAGMYRRGEVPRDPTLGEDIENWESANKSVGTGRVEIGTEGRESDSNAESVEPGQALQRSAMEKDEMEEGSYDARETFVVDPKKMNMLQAFTWYERALELHADNIAALNGLASIYWEGIERSACVVVPRQQNHVPEETKSSNSEACFIKIDNHKKLRNEFASLKSYNMRDKAEQLFNFGLAQNKTKAFSLFEYAASFGTNSDSLFNTGHCLHTGEGVERDLARAIKYYEAAALMGHFDANMVLGRLHYRGVSETTQSIDLENAEAVGSAETPRNMSGNGSTISERAFGADENFCGRIARMPLDMCGFTCGSSAGGAQTARPSILAELCLVGRHVEENDGTIRGSSTFVDELQVQQQPETRSSGSPTKAHSVPLPWFTSNKSRTQTRQGDVHTGREMPMPMTPVIARGRRIVLARSPERAMPYLDRVALTGEWGSVPRRAFDQYLAGDLVASTMQYIEASSYGYQVAWGNVAHLIDEKNPAGLALILDALSSFVEEDSENSEAVLRRRSRFYAMKYYRLAAVEALDKRAFVKLGDYYYYYYYHDAHDEHSLLASRGQRRCDGEVASGWARYAVSISLREWLRSLLLGEFAKYSNVRLQHDESLRQATYWYRRASDTGIALGAYNLAFMYRHGLGVERSDLLAGFFYNKALDLQPRLEIQTVVYLTLLRDRILDFLGLLHGLPECAEPSSSHQHSRTVHSKGGNHTMAAKRSATRIKPLAGSTSIESSSAFVHVMWYLTEFGRSSSLGGSVIDETSLLLGLSIVLAIVLFVKWRRGRAMATP